MTTTPEQDLCSMCKHPFNPHLIVPTQVVVDRDDLELGLRYLHGILTGQAYDVREVAVIYNELVAALSPDPSTQQETP